MKQQTLSDIEYGGRARITKREEFLDVMNEIIPWEEWVALIQPHYYEGKRGEVLPGTSNKCFGCICCNAGSTCRTKAWKTPSITVIRRVMGQYEKTQVITAE